MTRAQARVILDAARVGLNVDEADITAALVVTGDLPHQEHTA